MDTHYRTREIINYKEAEPEKREASRRKSRREHNKREKPKPSRNQEQHKNIIDNLKHINGDQMYNIALKNLRLLYRNNELSQNSFEYYKRYAEKRKLLAEKKLEKKNKSVSNDTHKGTFESNFDDESYESSKSMKFERKLEEEDDKEHKEKLRKTRVSQIKSILSFFKSPYSRVFLFVILGIFLLLYTTHGGMGNSLNSSMVLILIILFMVLILGKGGNTRTYDKSDWYE